MLAHISGGQPRWVPHSFANIFQFSLKWCQASLAGPASRALVKLRALGVEPERVFKTLLVESGRIEERHALARLLRHMHGPATRVESGYLAG